MTTYPGLQYLTWAVYLVSFALVLAKAIRTPTRAHWDMALFFGLPAVVIAISAAQLFFGLQFGRWAADLTLVLAIALPYILLRLVEVFAHVSAWLLRATELGLLAVVVGVLFAGAQFPEWLLALAVVYFGVVALYDAWAFAQQAGRTRGITRRRMQAIALGTGLITLDVVASACAQVLPGAAGALLLVANMCGLASGIAYYVGFSPPGWVRFAAQAPELRAFLERAAHLPYLPEEREVVSELERGAALTLGGQTAALGLWHPTENVLHFYTVAGLEQLPPADLHRLGAHLTPDGVDFAPDRLLAGRVFREQRPLLSINPERDDPRGADIYRVLDVRAFLGAPVSGRDRHHGVLAVWSPRTPVFAEGDLELVQLLAMQAATVLESRALLEETTRARARQTADELKDEFLASMSHDLRNPLTAVRGVAQILQRRLQRDGLVDMDRLSTGLESIGAATEQMNYLIDQILDAARVRASRPLDLDIRTTDLVALAETAVAAQQQLSDRHTIRLEVSAPSLTGQWDARRLERVLQNLLNNAIKYSPDGGEVLVKLEREQSPGGDWALLSVHDEGIGIPEGDMPHIFERFHRAGNVTGRITGSGIGLATARQVAEQHGGTLIVESREGVGSTFTLKLPIGSMPSEPPGGPDDSPTAQSTSEPSAAAAHMPSDHMGFRGGPAGRPAEAPSG